MSIDELGMEIKEVQALLRKNSLNSVERVFLNASEAERILNISRPTLLQLAKDGLLEDHSAESGNVNNKYLLSEILWLRSKEYRFLNPQKVFKLLQEKETEFKIK